MRGALALTAALALLAGCESDTADDGSRAGGDLPTTARALAAVAAEHVGEPRSAVEESDAAEEFAEDAVGTELRYGANQLVIAVGKGLDEALSDCSSQQNRGLAGCEETARGVLTWEKAAPESDPGGIYLITDKDDGAAVLIFFSGPDITGDPRELDLPVTVDELFDVANDARVDVTTSQAALEAAEDIAFWQAAPR